jgi:hypothetical protein
MVRKSRKVVKAKKVLHLSFKLFISQQNDKLFRKYKEYLIN